MNTSINTSTEKNTGNILNGLDALQTDELLQFFRSKVVTFEDERQMYLQKVTDVLVCNF